MNKYNEAKDVLRTRLEYCFGYSNDICCSDCSHSTSGKIEEAMKTAVEAIDQFLYLSSSSSYKELLELREFKEKHNKGFIVPAVISRNERSTIRQIEGYLDKERMIFYSSRVTCECLRANGWKITEGE